MVRWDDVLFISMNEDSDRLKSGAEFISDVVQMLNRISYKFQKKTAIYGAELSVSRCSVLYYLIQSKTLHMLHKLLVLAKPIFRKHPVESFK